MNVKINYTAYLVGRWDEIIRFHMPLIRRHLLERYDSKLSIFAYPYDAELTAMLSEFGINADVIWSHDNEYEFPALRDLVDNPSACNLYLHTNGVTKCDEYGMSWNRYMTNFVVGRCDECISELDAYDCVGVEFKTHPFPHYCGNFWWSNGKHLSKLKESGLLRDAVDRFNAEKLIGSVGGRFLSMCESDVNLYNQQFVESEWKRIDRIFTIG